ncbi:bacterio-opsin activator domain-containing protein [Halomarina litorea]|uniref:bacterio-opsin activator domain-containing protein n=1 Tax=Halomarina litorea TaxID=2961595 RepID=UPI0020C227FF|nr:bacterio-opsin activator domain-containing protein [Halomarina sp. BCD28]
MTTYADPPIIDEDLVRAVGADAVAGVLVVADGVVVDGTDRAAAVLGYDPGALVGTAVDRLFPDTLGATPLESGDRRMRTLDAVGADGSARPVALRTAPVDHEGERLLTAVVIPVERPPEYAYLRRTFEYGNDAVLVVDIEADRVRECNPRACDLFGYGREALLACAPSQLFPGEDESFRAFVRSVSEEGAGWTGELHSRHADGRSVPVEVTGTTLDLGGRPHLLVVVHDVSQRSTTERRLVALYDLTGELLRARTPTAVARLGSRFAARHLGFERNTVRLHDEETDYLTVVATTGDGAPDDRVPADDTTPLGRAYATRQTIVEHRDGARQVHVPLGDYGVFSVALAVPDETALTLRLAELTGTTLVSAFDAARREDLLCRREEQVRRTRESLDRLGRANALVRDIVQAVVAAPTRADIEQSVCDRLVASDLYADACILGRAADGAATPRASAGTSTDLFDVVVALDGSDGTPVVERLYDGEHWVARWLRDDPTLPPGARPAVAAGCRALAAVPVAHGSVVYGALLVSAPRLSAFGEEELASVRALGELVGFAVTAAAMTLVPDAPTIELEFRATDRELFFIQLCDALDCECELVWAGPTVDGRFIRYVAVEGAPPEAVSAFAAESPNVERHRVVSGHENGGLFEFVVTASKLHTLLELGASIRSVTARPGESRIVVEVPAGTDVRALVDTYRARHDDVQLVRKQHVVPTASLSGVVTASALGSLTERQRTVLQSAYFGGYYEWPRASTAEEIAAVIGISPSTFHEHLRKAHHHLLEALFEGSE